MSASEVGARPAPNASFRAPLRRGREKCDWADELQNSRILLCIDAGSRRTLEIMDGRSGRRSLPSGRSKEFPARCGGSRPYRVLSCFFRVIREIAVPLVAARWCLNARVYPVVSQYRSAQSQSPPAPAQSSGNAKPNSVVAQRNHTEEDPTPIATLRSDPREQPAEPESHSRATRR